MINYYEEFKIDPSTSLEEVNKELNQKEKVWHQRELTYVEKATKMLSLIYDARKVFQNDVTRAEYDFQLSESKKTLKSEFQQRSKNLDIWFETAKNYYDAQQYDLAKSAIEKALSLLDANDDDTSLYALAAKIYCENNITSTAMEYINKAIILEPDEASYYISKGFIYAKMNNYRSMQEMLEIAINKAQTSNDKWNEGAAAGTLAWILYFKFYDKEKAETIARKTVENGIDSYGNASRVLEDIKIQLENENKRLQIQNENEKMRKEISELNKKLHEEEIDRITGLKNIEFNWEWDQSIASISIVLFGALFIFLLLVRIGINFIFSILLGLISIPICIFVLYKFHRNKAKKYQERIDSLLQEDTEIRNKINEIYQKISQNQ